MRSWRSKRGKISTRRSYTLEAGTHRDIALEQMQNLLPTKKLDETFQHGNAVTDNGLGNNGNRNRPKKPKGVLDKRSDDQHFSKPTTFI